MRLSMYLSALAALLSGVALAWWLVFVGPLAAERAPTPVQQSLGPNKLERWRTDKAAETEAAAKLALLEAFKARHAREAALSRPISAAATAVATDPPAHIRAVKNVAKPRKPAAQPPVNPPTVLAAKPERPSGFVAMGYAPQQTLGPFNRMSSF